MKKMNLPNKLTIFRIVMIVPFVFMLLSGNNDYGVNHWGWYRTVFGGILEYTDYIALGIFIIASVTDWIDGRIARKYNLITNFGKFMDPLADKLLICSALIALVEMNRIPAWIVIIIISRDFIISGFRLIASDNRVVIAASYWGKFKTVIQMVMVCLMIVNISEIRILTNVVMWVALALTIISMVDYLVKNWDVMREQK